ncbi:AraC family transcriptional regulator [Solirubrobacter phytolaccae]|uniref:AraC family transcriptional regulator n=1 Tax=Solirubrobacter phytolaccae TaxID=1404360 RepID=A0A9X3N482_9ACTN|nr:AraC family transcriptional regulator [Solirubrobacter phytolaccae]MDA0179438.1 AraC family transcriptional regulator [Solirubrobacter phytolaccae]
MNHDVLEDVLSVTGVRGVLGSRIDAGSDWAWHACEVSSAAFHAVTHGSIWFAVGGGEPFELRAGDMILLPHGTEHVLGSDAHAVAHTSSMAEDAGAGVYRIGSGETRAHILCAHYEYDTPPFTSLPDVVVLHGADELEDTLRIIGRELTTPRPATSLILNSLVDVLLVQLLRAWLPTQPSWLGALRDPVVGAAVAKLHADPAREWTTATLAREAAVSRATLTRRFTSTLGESPGAYLTRWRMDLAARRLTDSDDSLEQVAAAVGYTSVYAFSRAFSRARAVPPGRYRAAARA